MKTSMLPIVFLQILLYVIHCTAAPTCPTPVTPTYTPTPTPTPTLVTFKLRVWNNPRAAPHFDGFSELSFGRMSFNITPGYTGFDLYEDPVNIGMIRQPPSGFYAVLLPTKTPGLYDFSITSRSTVQGALTVGFNFKYLICGQCVGMYLQYDPSTNAPDKDNTNASFLIVPNPIGSSKGSWSIQWNNYSTNPNGPAGSYRIQLLR